MEDLETVSSSEGNNPDASTETTDSIVDKAASEKPASTTKTEVHGTSTETAVKPEFSDPNMHAKFTQRMQELAAKEKEFNEKLKGYESKVSAFDKIAQDSKASQLLREYYEAKNAPPKPTELSQEEFLEISTDPKKFQSYLQNTAKELAKQMLNEQLGPISKDVGSFKEQIAQQKLEQEVSNFAMLKDSAGKLAYPDFYDHADEITVVLEKLAPVTNLTSEQKMEMAYKLVKYPKSQQSVVAEAHKIIEKKKIATGDRGGTGNGNFQRTQKRALTVDDAIDQAASELKWT